MAGGKGKSSGGKSSGGKVGADGGKKQQSHSSKAGLQVSIAQSSIQLRNSIFNGSGVYLSAGSMRKAIIPPPRRVALAG
jgi:histone H2A